MTSEALVEQTEGIQLFIDQDESGQVDSVVPVRWCISKELASQLQADDIQYPFMLLVITNGANEMGRYVVPLTREMAYIRFSRPGINTVHATVVWKGNSTRSSDLPNRVILDTRNHIDLISIHQSGYDALLAEREAIDARQLETEDIEEMEALEARRAEIVQQLGTEINKPYDSARLYGSFDGVRRSSQETTLQVDVPAAMFAKEPPRLIKWLGTLYRGWDKDAVDQCHLRRRALFTAVTLPIVAPIALVIALLATVINLNVAAVLLVSGRRGIDFRPLRHPLRYPPTLAWDDLGPSIWFLEKYTINYGDDQNPDLVVDYRRQPALMRTINPLTITMVTVVGLVLYFLFIDAVAFLVAPLVALVSLGLITEVIKLIVNRFFPDSWWEDRKKRRQERQKEREKAKIAELRAKRAEQLKQLSCNAQPRPADVAALPPEQQTIRLRFDRFKAQVCKPYAK